MSLYLDASVLVALFTTDPLTARADAFLRERHPLSGDPGSIASTSKAKIGA